MQHQSPHVKCPISEDGTTFYKIAVSIPPEFTDRLMDCITEIMDPIYPGYKRTFSLFPIRSTWIPAEGSAPYDGKIGETTIADEIRVEFAADAKDLPAVLDAILGIHPYEEPEIDVLPMIGWKRFIRP